MAEATQITIPLEHLLGVSGEETVLIDQYTRLSKLNFSEHSTTKEQDTAQLMRIATVHLDKEPTLPTNETEFSLIAGAVEKVILSRLTEITKVKYELIHKMAKSELEQFLKGRRDDMQQTDRPVY